VSATHELRASGAGQREDLLEATLVIRNTSDHAQQVEVESLPRRPGPRGTCKRSASMSQSALPGFAATRGFLPWGSSGF
jgi:hypothetical protein